MSRGRGVPQPQYDLITGSTTPAKRQPLRESFRSTQTVRPDEGNETLRKELHKLKYELESLKSEREVTNIRHEEDLRAAQARAEGDYKRAQASESANNLALSKHEALTQAHREAQEQSAEDRNELERQLRASKDRFNTLQEQVDEKDMAFADQERQHKYEIRELEKKQEPLQRELEIARSDRDGRSRLLKTAQQRLSEREVEVGDLQSEIMRLKAQTGDADSLVVIKRDLSEQVAHIKNLESQTTRQRVELRQLREQRKAVEVVEEEKRTLEKKVEITYNLRKELGEAQLQRQILEDERRAWSSFLENESTNTMDEDLHFDSPQALAKAFVQVRLEKLSLIDQCGKVQEELDEKDGLLRTAEEQRKRLKEDLENAKANGMNLAGASGSTTSDSKMRARIDRQRVLAVKEVEYLRGQLKMFDTEENELSPEKYDGQKAERISELERIIDQYRNEVQGVRLELEKAEQAAANPSTSTAPKWGNKRPRLSSHEEDEEAESERNGSLARRARSLQEELNQSTNARNLLQREVDALRTQLTSLQSTSRTRVLEFRANPTATAAAIKQTTLDILRKENEALLSRLDSLPASTEQTTNQANTRSTRSAGKLVPSSSLDRLRDDLAEKDRQLTSQEKSRERLKQSFRLRSLEFREAVASILGWKLDIMPNGRVRVRSMFDPVAAAAKAKQRERQKRGDEPDENEEQELDEERSIVYDGVEGTMKISGGISSRFADELRTNIEFWVDQKKEIPCFLAAVTMEFYERGAGTVVV